MPMLSTPICVLNVADGRAGCKLCTPVGTGVGYAGRVTEPEKGPRGLHRGRGARERILSASQQLFRDQGISRGEVTPGMSDLLHQGLFFGLTGDAGA
jgi:hypothetical protein